MRKAAARMESQGNFVPPMSGNIPSSRLPEILETSEPISLPKLLEEVLNEKKAALCQSPAVVEFLKDKQKTLATQHLHKEPSSSNQKCICMPVKQMAKGRDVGTTTTS